MIEMTLQSLLASLLTMIQGTASVFLTLCCFCFPEQKRHRRECMPLFATSSERQDFLQDRFFEILQKHELSSLFNRHNKATYLTFNRIMEAYRKEHCYDGELSGVHWEVQLSELLQEGGGYRKFERRVNDYGVLASLVVEIVFEVAQQLGCPGMANPHAIPFSALRCLAGMIWIGSSDPNALKLAKYLMMLICHLLAQNSLSLTILVVELMSKNGTNLTTSELTTLTPTTIAPTTVAPTTIASTTVAFAIFTRTTPAPHSLLSSIGYETEHEAM
ncbi:hypothetical protein QR680_010399 [Steinernema hermaphroditum]|uniref:Uncharacterized protein n=1 Tax=Steinernema hermaphroditum TaxID=289476 RepID=A0AA39IQN5_9BILA|nr:hypothetical protein QR680_010399 [Steinernema hermaphroditum]